MAAERSLDGAISEAVTLVQEDGLLAYLRTLYRVAHAPEASHWCTPGHNRGHALADPAPLILLPSPSAPTGAEAR